MPTPAHNLAMRPVESALQPMTRAANLLASHAARTQDTIRTLLEALATDTLANIDTTRTAASNAITARLDT